MQGVILFCVMFFNSANLKRMRQCLGKPKNRSSLGTQRSSGTANSANVTYQTNIVQSSNRVRKFGVTKTKDEVQV